MTRAVDQSSHAQQDAMIDWEAKPAQLKRTPCCVGTCSVPQSDPSTYLLDRRLTGRGRFSWRIRGHRGRRNSYM